MNRPDRKLAAALILSGGIGLTSVQDAFIKQISGGLPFHQMQTIRCGIALALILALLAARGELASLRVARPGLMAARSFTLALASALFYIGLAAISLADASAIYFTMPLMVAALSGLLIGERVHPWRWIAAGAGFAGVLLTISPGSSVFEPAALVTLAATILYAVGHMLARPLGDTMRLGAMAFYQCLAFVILAGLLSLLFGTGLFESKAHVSLAYLTRPWITPSGGDMVALLGFALATAFGMFVYSSAYRFAAPSFVAPFEYTSLLWAVALDFTMFGVLPKEATLHGAAIIVAAGLFLIWFERRSQPKPPPQFAGQ